MRKIISFVFALLVAVTVSSQSFRLSLEPGYGFYNMGKLHQLQEAGVNFYPGLGIKEVEKFPPFFNESGSILWYAKPNFLIGLTTGFLSTGARNSVKDYSGEYKLDMLVHANLYGMESEYNLQLKHNLKYFMNLKAGVISSTNDYNEYFVVSNTTLINDTEKNKESNLFIEPSTGIRYSLNKSFSLSVGVGYFIDFSANTTKSTNWSGCRLKSGVAYSL